MKSRIWVLFFILTLMITALLITGKPGSAQSGGTQPDYSKVDDFTNGETHLLRNDDLVATFTYASGSGERRQVLFSGGTNNSQASLVNYLDNTIIPSNQASCTTPGGCYLESHRFEGQKPVSGRFFKTTRDTTVLWPYKPDISASFNANPYWMVWLDGRTVPVGDTPGAGVAWTSAHPINFVLRANIFKSAVADFNDDGYDDLLMAYSDKDEKTPPQMLVATANDVNDPSNGFKGPIEAFTPSSKYIREVVVGDFNGDRQPDVATLSVEPNLNLILKTYTVDPNTLGFSEGSSVVITTFDNANDHFVDLVAGNFTSTQYQQIVVACSPQAKTGGLSANSVVLSFVDFEPGSIVPKSPKSSNTQEIYVDLSSLRIEAGRFNWSSPYDQIAFLAGAFLATRLSVMAVDPKTLTVVRTADTTISSDVTFIGLDIAVGNFDHMSPGRSNPSQLERNPDLQIALIGARYADQRSYDGAFYSYSVSEDYQTLTQEQGLFFDHGFTGGNNIIEMTLTAADLRGRSFRLGQGYKITVERAQPQTVLAMPPMHADYVSPSGGKDPTVVNFSVAPAGFSSRYKQQTSAETTVSKTITTSSSFSGEESLSGSVTLGKTDANTGELENGVKITDTFKAMQEIKDSTANINGDFNSEEKTITQSTGLSDVIWFEDSSYFLWVYPVIGRKVCPADKPNCKDSEKVPLQLMFSAPKPSTFQYVATDTVEWYQPPWEFGNILSYPAGLSQLKLYIPDINLLTGQQSVFATDDTESELETTWSNGRTTGQDVDHEELFSESNELSIEGATSFKILGVGAKENLSFDLNLGGSNGTQSLTKSETKFSSARGITIAKSAAFPTPSTYKYSFSPFIFGRIQPVGYTNTVPNTDALLSYGALRSAFTVDPLNTTVGTWWSQSPYKNFPDVALNHPNRWDFADLRIPDNNVVPPNCVNLGVKANGQMDCVTQKEREPENPWASPFHYMRGLFITNSKNPPGSSLYVAGGGGAQLQTATDGDTITLTTRVYNYSFKAMPANTKVKVRFYGMELTSDNYPLGEDGKVDPEGPSFLIGEVALADPIPPFSTAPNAPLNWLLASTNFNTSGRADQALAFWVVVWMEDASGNLVQELVGHGLAGKPPAGQAASFDAITKLEEMVSNPLGAPTEKVSFSNNIGFYKSAFHILPKDSGIARSTARAASLLPTVNIAKVEVGGTRLTPGKSVEGSVTLQNGDHDLFGVMVYFYDGDPAKGGRLIDLERLGRLRASSQHKVRILFRPKECGSHLLYVRVAPGRPHAVEGSATQPVWVDCPEAACFAPVCLKSTQYYANNLQTLPQGKVTIAGRGVVRDVDTSNTAAMSQTLTRSNGALNYFNQQSVALQLSLLGSGDPSAAKSNLLCYGVSFQPVKLSTLETISSTTTIEELLKHGKLAAQRDNLFDLRTLAQVMRFLNGDDPVGRCRSNP